MFEVRSAPAPNLSRPVYSILVNFTNPVLSTYNGFVLVGTDAVITVETPSYSSFFALPQLPSPTPSPFYW